MPQGFRFEPTTVAPDRIVDRWRLVKALNGRFDHRVTTVVGAAGYGKSTLLATSVANNLLDPVGRDVWLAVAAPGATGVQLMGAIATALELDGEADVDESVGLITDALWSAAPDEVALIVDDVHLANGTDATDALARLVDRLPANGHLVLGSRHRLGLPLARLRAQRQLLEIDESDLALDDDELRALERRDPRRAIDPGDHQRLPRHVATADLQLAAGVDAGADFLWEEVLVRLDEDRLVHLRRCAVIDSLDDELVCAMTDGAHDAGSLLDGLPLVEVAEGGRRMHAILREALTSRSEPGELRKALSIAAVAEQERGNLPAAVDLHFRAGDHISALDAARRFAVAPTVTQAMDDVISIRRIVSSIDNDAPFTQLLDALTHFAGLEDQIADRFLDVADVARAAGDIELETIALHRAGQSQLLHHAPGFWETYQRTGELVERHDRAKAVYAYFSSVVSQLRGRPDESVRALDDLGPLGRSVELHVRSERLYDLGRPEQVAVGLTADDVAALPTVATAFVAISMWARGDALPDVALPFVSDSIERAMRARYTHPLVIYLSSGVHIALAAGETDLARRWSDRAREHDPSRLGASVAYVELVARASLLAVTEGDDRAIELLQTESLEHEHFADEARQWPARALLSALPLAYLARPDLRPLLDGCEFGPSLRSMVGAGQALVDLRERGDTSGAAELPWGRVGLLRANVLPHHLAELACAATLHRNDEAARFIDRLPDPQRALTRVATSGPAMVAAIASDMLGAVPRPEPFRLHALTLGGIRLQRDGVDLVAPDFAKRHKVRELFALLLERGRLQRHEICAAIWPEHEDEERALASLRTTLSTLNGALEPDRERGQSAFHLVLDGDTVELDPRVTSDVDEFERLVADAQSDDAAGLPARALEACRRAADLYRGDYLHGIDAPWLVLTRLRLRTLAVSTMCRVAELEAARGEPEEAARWAAKGRTLDPLNERAGRVFVAALDAAGDRSAARDAAHELATTLRAADLEPSSVTARLIDRLS